MSAVGAPKIIPNNEKIISITGIKPIIPNPTFTPSVGNHHFNT